MSLNLRDLENLDFQEISAQESKAVIGGAGRIGCIIGGVLGALSGKLIEWKRLGGNMSNRKIRFLVTYLVTALLVGVIAEPALADRFNGTNGNNSLSGTYRDDVMLGNGGDDKMWGRNGNDVIQGGPGNDTISGGNGVDAMYGEDGDDWIYATESSGVWVFDTVVDCGSGYDTVFLDGVLEDGVHRNCEVVIDGLF